MGNWGTERKAKLHYAWIILLIIFIGLLSTQGLRLSFGAFIDPWQKQFATDRETLSMVSMVSFFLYGVSQPLFGKLVDRYGVRKVLACNTLLVGCSTILSSLATTPWHLMVIYGIISAIGFGGTSGTVAAVAVTNWFTEKRGLAFGMIEAGFAAGQMVVVPSSILLISSLGWKMTVVSIGVVLCLIVFPLLLLFLRDRPAEKGLRSYGEQESAHAEMKAGEAETKLAFRDILKMRAFWFLILPFFVCGFTTSGLMDTHMVPYCYDMGFSEMVTSSAVGLLAAFNIAGTLLSGKLADHWSNQKMLGFIYAARTLSMIILLTTDNAAWLMVFSMLFGFVDFATQAPSQLLATRYFKGASMGVIFGVMSMSHQVGSALGSYIPGLLYERLGGYHLSFIIATLLLVLASLCSFLLPTTGKIGKTSNHAVA